MISFSPDMRQGICSLGILLLIVFGFYILLVQPAVSTRSQNTERIEDLMFQSSKFALSAQNNAPLINEIKQLEKENPSKKYFLDGNAPAIVAADLQKNIKTFVKSSGGNLISSHALGLREDELFPKVTVKIHMRTDINALRDVLYQIAISRPLLFTENVMIQRKGKQADNRIEVRFDVSGYINPSPI